MKRQAFALIELLVVIAIIATLAVVVAFNWPVLRSQTQRTAALNNMRNIGAALRLYSVDHLDTFPRRITNGDKWPKLLSEYMDGTQAYAAVGDTNNYIFQKTDPLSNARNNTSYIMNGFNDVGAYTNQEVTVRMLQIESPSETILLGTPKSGSTHFYMDMLEGESGNHIDVLNLELYNDGSAYAFADGSARYIRKRDYDHRMWLVNKDFLIP